jgi:hypothetical protein
MSADSFVYEFENSDNNTISWQELVDKLNITNINKTI